MLRIYTLLIRSSYREYIVRINKLWSNNLYSAYTPVSFVRQICKECVYSSLMAIRIFAYYKSRCLFDFLFSEKKC